MKQTVNIVCAKAPVKLGCVPAVRLSSVQAIWICSWCGGDVSWVAW